MRRLLPEELKQRFTYRVDACATGDLLSKPERAASALVISPQGHIPKVRAVVPRDRPPIPITYSSGDAYLDSIRRLATPSVIARLAGRAVAWGAERRVEEIAAVTAFCKFVES